MRDVKAFSINCSVNTRRTFKEKPDNFPNHCSVEVLDSWVSTHNGPVGSKNDRINVVQSAGNRSGEKARVLSRGVSERGHHSNKPSNNPHMTRTSAKESKSLLNREFCVEDEEDEEDEEAEKEEEEVGGVIMI